MMNDDIPLSPMSWDRLKLSVLVSAIPAFYLLGIESIPKLEVSHSK